MKLNHYDGVCCFEFKLIKSIIFGNNECYISFVSNHNISDVHGLHYSKCFKVNT